MKVSLLVLLLSVFVCSAVCSIGPHGMISNWVRGPRANAHTLMPVVFAVSYRESGVDTLKEMIDNVSNPQSALYGKYATRDQLDELLNCPMKIATVMKFLESHHAENIVATGAFIKASLPVHVLEKTFSTRIHKYTSPDTDLTLNRAHTYTIPSHLPLDFIGYMNFFPSAISRGPIVHSFGTPAHPAFGGSVDPGTLNSVYSIDNNTLASQASTVCAFESGQGVDNDDLATFSQTFSSPSEQITTFIGENNDDCAENANDCAEASLDFEYMLAVAAGGNSTFWSISETDEQPFLDWLIAMQNTTSPPLVNSASYGEVEQQVPSNITSRFEIELQKVGARGMTVTISSGDDGVANFPARNDSTQCGFFPSYPASSAYATAVGGTQGPESGTPEIACTSNGGGIITSGGGFSTVWTTPSYQSAAVNAYLTKNAGSTLPPANQFNSKGRGYPDVALLTYNYNVIIGGQQYAVSGTSASSPVFAGMIALVNGVRLAAGKASLGFLNPALYQIYASDPSIFNDITSGENNCAAENTPQTCCQYGFTAVTGWDPVTGLGSVNFTKLKAALLALP